MKYLAKIALNKEGFETEQTFEMPEFPCTISELEAAERRMFDLLCKLFELYRDRLCDNDESRILNMCNFEDWQRDNIRFDSNAICWSSNRGISDAHIYICRA